MDGNIQYRTLERRRGEKREERGVEREEDEKGEERKRERRRGERIGGGDRGGDNSLVAPVQSYSDVAFDVSDLVLGQVT